PATVVMVLPLGPSVVYELRTADAGTLKVTLPRHEGEQRFEPGQAVGLQLRQGAPAAVFLPEVAA
ncbi:MAG TPA: TOBE domain-containing protein, partial [Rubrivivax sp.]|nr:TOBE domain-containing protein [Rubrivivax sp.]